MGSFRDLTGLRFGRLLVSKLGTRSANNSIRWVCKCDCGNICLVLASSLSSHHTLSCGCYKQDIVSKTHRIHGMSFTRFYRIWAGIVQRCTNKHNAQYMDYGGKGVYICDKWKSFNGFEKDMYKSYLEHSKLHGEKNTTIDRIDVSKGYSSDNCEWATRKKQARNKRCSLKLEFNGKTMVLSDWAKEYGVNKSTLWRRVVKQGLPIEKAIGA